ncbi:MAG: TonB-dependent receptor [Endomicrobiales bacterium]
MITKIGTVVAALCLSMAVYAQDDLFLSLTKTSESLENTPTSVSVVTATQIKSSGARNLGEAVENVTGLSSGLYGSLGANDNIMLRGSSPEQVLILMDGMRLNDPSTGLVDLTTIPVDNIERIEIIRGGVSALYGTSAFGGIVNIITKKPAESGPAIGVNLSAGSFNTQQYGVNFGVKNNNLSGYFTAGKITTDGYRDNSAYANNNVFARLGYTDPVWGDFDLTGTQFSSNAGVPGMGIDLSRYNGTLEKEASTPDANQQDDNSSIRLQNTKKFDAGTLKTTVYVNSIQTDYQDPGSLTNDSYQSTTAGSELQFTTLFGLTAGAEWYDDLYQQIDKNTGATTVDVSRTTTAGYLQQQFTYNKLLLIPSIRLDDNSIFGSVVCPRITAIYHLTDCVKISANSGKAWAAPTFDELYWPMENDFFFGTNYITIGNPNLKPEEGITSDIGAEYHTPCTKTSLTYYVTQSNNLINWSTTMNASGSIATTTPVNIGQSQQEGVEFEFSQKIFSGLSHKINYTYLWAEDTLEHIQLPYRPQDTLNYELIYQMLTQTQAKVTVHYVGSQATGDPTITELPGFTTVNCRISQKFKQIELWVGVDDIFDIKYQTRLYYPLPGQTISAGLNWKFQG